MLYDLVQKRRGKETVVMTGELSKVNDKKKQLLASQRRGIRGQRVEYHVRPSDSTDKKDFVPHDMYLGGQERGHPRVPRK